MPHGPADLDGERRLLPWAQAALVGLAVTFAVGSVVVADAFRDLFAPLVDVLRDSEASQDEIDAAVDAVTARQDEYWWLNVVTLLPVAGLAGLAVWTNKVAHTARALGYPARHSPGWGAGGWFVPIVNLWFPYQSIVDSMAPTNPDRRRVLAWWLLYLLGGAAALPVVAAGVFGTGSLAPWAVPAVAVATLQLVLGLRVLAMVHDDHERAAASR